MDQEPKVDLKQYIPKKGSKRYIVKIIIYVSVLLFLIYMVTLKLKNEKTEEAPSKIEEIKGVKIEI
jgi:hypothetical protein